MNTGKVIYLHKYRTGRLRRYAYYNDLRAVCCARGLLMKSGWIIGSIKKKEIIGKYYLFSEKLPAKPMRRQSR